jgi:hypothetical protein
MIVFRVETENGEGPYNTEKYSYTARELNRKHRASTIRPSPHFDISGWTYDDYFGFNSIKSFREWFDDSWAELKKMGCRLKAYKVDDEHVMLGSKQVCFRKDRATLIREFVI